MIYSRDSYVGARTESHTATQPSLGCRSRCQLTPRRTHTLREGGPLLSPREQAQTRNVLLVPDISVSKASSQKQPPGSQQRSPSATEREEAGSGPGEARDVGTGRLCDRCGICRKRWEEPHLAASVSLQQQAVPTGDRAGRLGRESLFLAASTGTCEAAPARFCRKREHCCADATPGKAASQSSWE